MPVGFLSFFIIKYLCRNDLDTVFGRLIPILPDIDKNDGSFALILLFHFLHDGGHHFTRDAFFGAQIDHGDHAFDRQPVQIHMALCITVQSGHQNDQGEDQWNLYKLEYYSLDSIHTAQLSFATIDIMHLSKI